MFRPALIALVLVVAGCAAPDTTNDTLTPETVSDGLAAVRADDIREGVAFLASDELRGRGTGTPDKERAARWIADELQAVGAVPLTGDSYLQEIKLIGTKKVAETSEVTLNGPGGTVDVEQEVDFTWWPADGAERVELDDVPLVFVGHGITAPEVDWDDYGDTDVSGKVLVFLNDDPLVEEDDEVLFGGPTRTYYGRWTYKFEQAKERGAVGAIVIHTTESAGYGWQVIGTKGASEQFGLDKAGAGYDMPLLAWMAEDVAQELAATVGETLETWFEQGKRRDFQPVDLPVTISASADVAVNRTTSHNVLGLIEGSDPDLKDEIVVVTAHYDHLGVITSDDPEADTIYNGAWDNAAGTSEMLAIARGIAASEIPPRRSVLFFAVGAHEKGLLGSRWFVESPPVPMIRFAANVNVDMPQIFGVTRDIVAIGRDKSELGAILEDVASRFELPEGGQVVIADDPTPGAGRFYRSDQLHFARKGVPGIYLGPGTDYVNGPTVDPVQYRADHYHQLSDELTDAWNFEGLERDARVIMLAVLELARRDARPQWSPGSEFGRPAS